MGRIRTPRHITADQGGDAMLNGLHQPVHQHEGDDRHSGLGLRLEAEGQPPEQQLDQGTEDHARERALGQIGSDISRGQHECCHEYLLLGLPPHQARRLSGTYTVPSMMRRAVLSSAARTNLAVLRSMLWPHRPRAPLRGDRCEYARAGQGQAGEPPGRGCPVTARVQPCRPPLLPRRLDGACPRWAR